MAIRETSPTGVRIRQSAILDLESHLLGDLIRPSHDDYESARHVYNGAVNRKPALIARAADAADVIRSIAFARQNDLPLAVRSGGHNVAGTGTVDGGLVIDLSRMRGLSIDPERRVAWAQPGLTWGEYAQGAHAYGLATSSGDSATVGVGGLTLGGGIGWMVRKYGLTIDHLLSAELVTADGRLLRASIEERPELFWALRGGGGNFGVATAFQFKLHPAGTVIGGRVVYPATVDVLRGWADYVLEAPDELTSMALITPAPTAPFIPAEQVGKLVAVLAVVYVGDLTQGQRVVAPLRQLGTPVADIIAPRPYPAMLALAGEGVQRKMFAQRSGYMVRLDDDVLAAMLEHAERMPVPNGQIELRGLGGAMARVPADETAFAHRDKPYMVTSVAAALDRAGIDRQREWTENLWNVLRPQARGAYVNFLEDEGAARVREAYSPGTYQRLLAVKRDYDPNNVFRHNQNIA